LCLTTNVKFQKALLLLGTGSNGKSIIIQVMERIWGKGNFSNIELHALSNKHYVIELQNKLVNFCSEIDHKGAFSSDVFKRIVSGETLTGDRKFKDPAKFNPYCKLLFAANDLPKTSDTTRGYFRRFLILKFNRRFEGKEKDPFLIDKLLNEVDGIFTWILEGLERLLKNDQFTIPASSEEEIERYLEISNSVVSFVNDQCEISVMSNYRTSYRDLYGSYKEYCKDSGHLSFSKPKFRKEIENQYQNRVLYSKNDDERIFKNIRLNPVD
jgi:putative DNA primase/helicase